MASLTAVELGADTCALARTSVRGADVRVYAAETLDPAAFPGNDSFARALRQTRQRLKLPRRCRAVLWGLREGATRRDMQVTPLIAPLAAAGFKVERIVSPCDALAGLARLRMSRGENATCWLAINRGGVAIVVVRPGRQLYAHSFAWDSSLGATGSQARLLQRYSLVSHLSPEVKRAMAVARQHGTPVDGIVTCGNLPDLRSLTMPLIEELDVEVETLDSLEGIVVSKEVADRLSEIAPAIRLACAGAVARRARLADAQKRRRVRATGVLLRTAAVLAGVAAVAYAWYVKPQLPFRPAPAQQAVPAPATPAAVPPAANTKTAAPRAAEQRAAERKAAEQRAAQQRSAEQRASEQRAAEQRAAEQKAAEQRAAEQKAAEQRAAEQRAQEQRAAEQRAAEQKAAEQRAAERKAAEQRAAEQRAAEQRAAQQKAAEQKAAEERAARGKPIPPAAKLPPFPPARPPAAAPQKPTPRVNSSSAAADKPGAARRATAPLAPPLKDPLPKVLTILVAGERRYATVEGGQIIGIGDLVGRRTVVAIEERAVVLREPSGREVRVSLGGRGRSGGPPAL